MLLNIATWVSILFVFGFALFQFLLTLGVPFGEYALGGMHKVLPAKMRLISGFFTCFFIIVGMSYLQRAGLIKPLFSDLFTFVLLTIHTLFLAYAIIGNGFLTKSIKEKYLMTPFSIIGCISSIYVLIGC